MNRHTIARAIALGVASLLPHGAQAQPAGAFDPNSDTITDVLVESPPAPGQSTVGTVQIVSGTNGVPIAVLTSPSIDDLFGLSASAIGDLDGDGASEIAVPAPGEAFDTHRPGRVYIYDGATNALIFALEGDPYEFLTWRVDAAHDLDDDGFQDIIVQTLRAYDGGILVDAWHVFSGATGKSIGWGFYPQRWWPIIALPALSDSNVLPTADVNGDGLVTASDLFEVAGLFGQPIGPAEPADVVVNGFVDFDDFLEVNDNLGITIDPFTDLMRALSAIGHTQASTGGGSFAAASGRLGCILDKAIFDGGLHRQGTMPTTGGDPLPTGPAGGPGQPCGIIDSCPPDPVTATPA